MITKISKTNDHAQTQIKPLENHGQVFDPNKIKIVQRSKIIKNRNTSDQAVNQSLNRQVNLQTPANVEF